MSLHLTHGSRKVKGIFLCLNLNYGFIIKTLANATFLVANVMFSVAKITYLTVGQFLDHITRKSKTDPQ